MFVEVYCFGFHLESIMNGLLTIRLADIHSNPRAALDAAAELGARAVELDAAEGPFIHDDFGATAVRELAHRIAAGGMAAGAVRYDAGSRRLTDSATVDTLMGMAVKAIRFAGEIGSRAAIVHAGHPGDDAVKGKGSHPFHAVLGDLAQTADLLGVRLCVEAAGWTVSERMEYLERRGLASVLIEFDPALELSRREAAVENLVKIGNRCGAILARDGYRAGGDAPFGTGDVPWSELAKVVELSGFSGPIIVCPSVERGDTKKVRAEKALSAARDMSGATDKSWDSFGKGKLWLPE